MIESQLKTNEKDASATVPLILSDPKPTPNSANDLSPLLSFWWYEMKMSYS